MDSFESLIAMLLKRDGYWTTTSFRVELSKSEKRQIGRHSSPRWELDVLAYDALNNEVRVVECKSFLDSRGVTFRNGAFDRAKGYKLFGESKVRRVVFRRLEKQLVENGACLPKPTITLCLAAGHIWKGTDLASMKRLFKKEHWQLYGPTWIRAQLTKAASSGYENDVAHVVAKLLNRVGPATECDDCIVTRPA